MNRNILILVLDQISPLNLPVRSHKMALFIDWNPLILYSRSERKLPNSACAFLKLVTLICNVYVFLIYASLNLITLIEIHIYFIIYIEINFYLTFFNRRIVNLQGCVNFCCTAKWFSYTWIYILFHIPFCYGLSQDMKYSFLCSAVGPCSLSVLYIERKLLKIFQ